MQNRKLSGSALASHEAKLAGVRLPLRGAALTNSRAKRPGGRRSEMVGIVGLMTQINKEHPIDQPMMIGDQVVEQFPESAEVDDRVPWDGVFESDENFAVSDESTGEVSLDDRVRLREERQRLMREQVVQARKVRRAERRARKAIGLAKVEPGYRELERELQDAETTAQFEVRQALAHHQHTKKELARCRQMLAGLRSGNPASPAVTGMAAHLPPNRILRAEAQVRAMTPAELALPVRLAQ